MEKPFINVMKLEAMDVIATSGVVQEPGYTIESLTTTQGDTSIGF
jgi:hypothetical protein